ncbi:GNAT family N-acetyltransferase [Streptomyces sp. DvalAA-19]|uniref:GNAT family N-acetyltransferase n=1 Tax=Streptomyces sp. DvalAA-19 TaxID=1839761 RepID=UPI00081B16C0|nr:GNAT family N-acetyltransferase [Streptomyces sp. DvalAA-19]SCD97952.1 hypothetical protein GA0115244_1144111 [Streptomyces sp. DvalAA-19]
MRSPENVIEIRRLFDRELREHARPDGPGVRVERAGPVVRQMAGPVELPEGVSLRPVTDAAGAELMARAHERAFSTDGRRLLHQVVRRLEEAPEEFVAVMAVDGDGEPVCSGRMELYPGTGFAGLWGGGTVADWRGKGVYRALVAYRARIAAERGYRYLQVDATDMSAPILRRLGFLELGTTTPYVYRPAR